MTKTKRLRMESSGFSSFPFRTALPTAQAETILADATKTTYRPTAVPFQLGCPLHLRPSVHRPIHITRSTCPRYRGVLHSLTYQPIPSQLCHAPSFRPLPNVQQLPKKGRVCVRESLDHTNTRAQLSRHTAKAGRLRGLAAGRIGQASG